MQAARGPEDGKEPIVENPCMRPRGLIGVECSDWPVISNLDDLGVASTERGKESDAWLTDKDVLGVLLIRSISNFLRSGSADARQSRVVASCT